MIELCEFCTTEFVEVDRIDGEPLYRCRRCGQYFDEQDLEDHVDKQNN